MNTKVDKELLFRYFSSMTTPLENAGIGQWLEGEGNEEIFYFYLESWERKNAQYTPDRERVFRKFGDKLEARGHSKKRIRSQDKKRRITMSKHRRWWAFAASLIILISVTYLAQDHIFFKTYNTRFGETMTLVLDDDSRVVLNANTQLTIPRWIAFFKDREVWMRGEAFFNVTKKEDHSKFIVHTHNLHVEVLGTRFNISDRRDATKVVLQEGKVKVTANTSEGETAMLEEVGDYAEVKEESPGIIVRTVDESLYTTWQEKRLKFKETPVSQVLQTIEDYYGVRVESSDSTIYQRKFSGTLPNNDLKIILQALSNIYGSGFTQTKLKTQD